MEDKIIHCWYSHEHKLFNQECNRKIPAIYYIIKGKKIEVTCISNDRDNNSYLWKDKIYLGTALRSSYKKGT